MLKTEAVSDTSPGGGGEIKLGLKGDLFCQSEHNHMSRP